MTEQQAGVPEGEQEMMRLYILFGILFRVVMVDLGKVRVVPLKLSYQAVYDWLFPEISRWAERQHHQLRRLLRQQGCVVVSYQRQGHVYVVHYRQRGYLREAIYSIEILRAECQELVGQWIAHYQRGEKTP
ncbi:MULTISPECIES: hypothetical protein [Brevibacillus]|uniref:Uncharacterized protein n=2 Tax=Brevibacillus TaxID=55080 RepID=A0A1I3TC65_9BACL|nr:hypothetical protein [Brevibacillus centrosporus]GED28873.1 hypothetical protein BCE02nite_00140 [Brevibacillus centrosporus]SFJ67321.1 hypothetical protein SAMN05518846_104465 [Brevibacillus centrosporus]